MSEIRRAEIRFAIKQSVPVMLGYLFLGFAFGLTLNKVGYHPIWAVVSSVFIYAGSMQFVLVNLLTGSVGLIQCAIMTLFINGRHLFYGLSFVEKFRKMGKKYPYMVFSLTDETYSLLLELKTPEGMDEKRVSFLISLFDQLYWITGSLVGAVAGELISFPAEGIDFSMTALFVVIMLNQWLDNKEHRPALTGLIVGVLCLLLLGPDNFLLPALGITAAIFLGVRKVWNIQ